MLLSSSCFELLCNIVNPQLFPYYRIGGSNLRGSKLSICRRIQLLKELTLLTGIGLREKEI